MEADLAAMDNGNNINAEADIEIEACLNPESPKSFFLLAGAGSGKTRSLVNALKYLQKKYNRKFRLHGKRVGVITYTNKACAEIKHRIGYDPLAEVSTIHSFVWTLIQGLNEDIRIWLQAELELEIADLFDKEKKGRSGTKASLDRQKDIENKSKRLSLLPNIRKFKYNPNGENRGSESLTHNEVIRITASFLSTKPAMQRLLINSFPILLIDESQDTNKLLIEAFLSVQAKYPTNFTLGLFGDTMQRIYADGKQDLGHNLPEEWATPKKKMNHRCPKRVITLINRIRADVDNHEQLPRTDTSDGTVRLFILNANNQSKQEAEKIIARKMAEQTSDAKWENPDAVKTLILEHHMAAKRMGFLDMYEPLYRNDTLKIGLLDGTLGGVKLFSERVLPLIEAKRKNDSFAVAAIVRKHSPLLSKSTLREAGSQQTAQIQKTRNAVEKLWSLCSDGKSPRFIDILRCIVETDLFEIPENLRSIAVRSEEEQELVEADIANYKRVAVDDKWEETVFDYWDQFLLAPFKQIKPYVKCVRGQASFDTHQGVKGLEFHRVMVIIDDSEAKGFLFSYDKLFGVKGKTKADLDNEKLRKETGIDRTRRLFYVTCSRAKESLAIVAYSDKPKIVKEYVIQQSWFGENEVEVVSIE